MKYQNNSRVTKTFHGVTFKPGDVKEVHGYINDKCFVRVKDNKEAAKKKTSNSSAAKQTSASTNKSTVKEPTVKKDQTTVDSKLIKSAEPVKEEVKTAEVQPEDNKDETEVKSE